MKQNTNQQSKYNAYKSFSLVPDSRDGTDGRNHCGGEGRGRAGRVGGRVLVFIIVDVVSTIILEQSCLL